MRRSSNIPGIPDLTSTISWLRNTREKLAFSGMLHVHAVTHSRSEHLKHGIMVEKCDNRNFRDMESPVLESLVDGKHQEKAVEAVNTTCTFLPGHAVCNVDD